jgi:hypothetical protein
VLVVAIKFVDCGLNKIRWFRHELWWWFARKNEQDRKRNGNGMVVMAITHKTVVFCSSGCKWGPKPLHSLTKPYIGHKKSTYKMHIGPNIQIQTLKPNSQTYYNIMLNRFRPYSNRFSSQIIVTACSNHEDIIFQG